MSSPHDNLDHPSLNSLIDKDLFSLKYVKLDDSIAVMKTFGTSATLCKADIADAFKQIPIHPDMWHLHGIRWDTQLYFYTRLVFGSRSSPKIFDTLSVALCWVARNVFRIEHILHLLDDFLMIDDSMMRGRATMENLRQMFGELCIPLSQTRLWAPHTVWNTWESYWMPRPWRRGCRKRSWTGF